MAKFRIRLLLSSLLLCCACGSEYRSLKPVEADPRCIAKLKPAGLQTSWYNAGIDVVGKHISGLLLLKNMPDKSMRIVFTNEAGITFLDFEFSGDHRFTVHHILKQLDKKVVINLLRKDFELLLGIPFQTNDFRAWSSDREVFYGAPEKKETDYFITDMDCASLHRLETGSKRKKKVTLMLYGTDLSRPDSVNLQHHTFAMRIRLKKIDRN
jgi:hypothetical protein